MAKCVVDYTICMQGCDDDFGLGPGVLATKTADFSKIPEHARAMAALQEKDNFLAEVIEVYMTINEDK